MYQPRRAAAPALEIEPLAVVVDEPVFGAPRRVAPRWHDGSARKAGAGVAALATVAAGGITWAATQNTAAAVGAPTDLTAAAPLTAPAERDLMVASRSADRVVSVTTLAESSLSKTTQDLTSRTPLYTTGTLNLREDADADSTLLGSVGVGTRVFASPIVDGKYRLVETEKGDAGWVLAANLKDAEPEAEGGITMAKCNRGSSIEGKLRPDTIRIYRSVCALFPGVNSYGGWRAGGRAFHKNGRAVDIMLTPGKESALGWKIAKYLTKNAKAFNVDHVIFEQKIWTPRSPRWRGMANRGSSTANHMDHVHVAIKA